MERHEWKPEEDERLRELAAEGHSARAIADALAGEFGRPITRNAVIGKTQRGGVALLGPRVRTTRRREGRLPTPAAAVDRPAEEDRHCSNGGGPLLSSLPFLERRPGQCAWPLWEWPERIGPVCGRPVPLGSGCQFCAEHLARSRGGRER